MSQRIGYINAHDIILERKKSVIHTCHRRFFEGLSNTLVFTSSSLASHSHPALTNSFFPRPAKKNIMCVLNSHCFNMISILLSAVRSCSWLICITGLHLVRGVTTDRYSPSGSKIYYCIYFWDPHPLSRFPHIFYLYIAPLAHL